MPTPTPRPTTAATTWSPPSPSWATTLTSPRSRPSRLPAAPRPADILAALPGVTYSGISGEISFDDIGDAKRDAAYIKTANTETGAWDFVKIQGID